MDTLTHRVILQEFGVKLQLHRLVHFELIVRQVAPVVLPRSRFGQGRLSRGHVRVGSKIRREVEAAVGVEDWTLELTRWRSLNSALRIRYLAAGTSARQHVFKGD